MISSAVRAIDSARALRALRRDPPSSSA